MGRRPLFYCQMNPSTETSQAETPEEKKGNLLWSQWLCVLPALTVLIFIAAFSFVAVGIGIEWPAVDIPWELRGDEQTILEKAARTRWATALLATLVTATTAFALGVAFVLQLISPARRKQVFSGLLLLAFLICTAAWIFGTPGRGITGSLTEAIPFYTQEWSERTGSEGPFVLTNLASFLKLLSGFVSTAAACLFLAVGFLLGFSAKEKLEDIAKRRMRLHWILYVGSLLMVFGTLTHHFLHSWQLQILSTASHHQELARAIEQLAQAGTAMTGFRFSLMLIALYVPAMLVFGVRIQQKLKSTATTPEEEQTLVEKLGLSFTLKSALPRLMALLAPLLAEPAISSLAEILNLSPV